MMKRQAALKASPEPTLPQDSNATDSPVSAEEIAKPASNATRQLDKPRVRRKARADQATLLKKGPDALPVSDYPLKENPAVANSLDLRERKRTGS